MSVAVSSTGNGVKRSAASLDSDQPAQQQQHQQSMVDKTESEMSPPPPEKRSFIVVESPLKLGTISSAVS